MIRQKVNQHRVALATVAGTTVEWYDFFTYTTAAGLVFSHIMFTPAGEKIGLMLSFATVGISFLFRPLGAFIAGSLGDRFGRRSVLVTTLIMMGAATTLIGVLPTYSAIGVAAPVLLILLRIIQGISAGGEWGGAALMAVEHAPAHRRGVAGTFPQLGVPLGMMLASGVFALMTGVIAPGEAFFAWGWRVPFLLSFVLVIIGHLIRRSVDESPVFQEIADRKKQSSAPVSTLFRSYCPLIIAAALLFAGNNAGGYMTTGGFITSYASQELSLDRTHVLLAVTASSGTWFFSTLAAGFMADAIGRRRTYLIGYTWLVLMAFPLLWFADTRSIPMLTIGLCLFSVGLGLTYGPQAAWYAELFPAHVRFSGVSISYAIGAILGGAFAPTISQALVNATGTSATISIYLACMFAIGAVAALVLQDNPGCPLGIDAQSEQEKSTILRLSARYCSMFPKSTQSSSRQYEAACRHRGLLVNKITGRKINADINVEEPPSEHDGGEIHYVASH